MCVKHIKKAIKDGEIPKGALREIRITPTRECLDTSDNQALSLMKTSFIERSCLMNSCRTASTLNIPCCEGVAFIIPEGGATVEGGWIRHCWNKKNGYYFDVTREYAMSVPVKEMYYFMIEEHKSIEYEQQLQSTGGIEFISKAVKFSDILNNYDG